MAENISSTHTLRDGKLGRFQQAYGTALSSELLTSHVRGHETPLPDHALVESMLKNSTEIGDLSLFSFKPARAPPSGPPGFLGALTVPGALQRACPQTSYHVYGRRPINEKSENPQHFSKKSSNHACTSDQHSPDTDHSESDRGRLLDAERSASLSKSSYRTHALISRHPSGYSCRSQGPLNVYSARPRTPLVYPTRLRRPGYRPSSPAPSNLSGSSPLNTSDDRGHRTASSASASKTSNNVSTWRKAYDQSVPATQYDPPPKTPDPSNFNARKPALSLHSTASSSHLSGVRTIDDASWTNLHCSLSPPVFYDYTEAFEEHTHVPRSSLSIAQHIGARPSQDGRQQMLDVGASPEVSFLAGLPCHASRLHEQNGVTTTGRLSCVPDLQEDHSGEPQSSYEEGFFEEATNASKDDLEEATAPVNSPREAQLVILPDEADLQRKNLRRHSSHCLKLENGLFQKPRGKLGSQSNSGYSADSFTTKEHSEETTAPTSAFDAVTENLHGLLRTPSNVGSTELAVNKQGIETGPSLSQIAEAGPNSHEILAPTPERSITALIARRRLSKILSIDENSSEVGKITAAPTPSLRCASPENISSSRDSYVTHKVRNTMASFTCSEDLTADYNGSGDEHELSKVLRETFSRPRCTVSGMKMSAGASLTPSQTKQTLHTEKYIQSEELAVRQASPSVRLSNRKTSIIHDVREPDHMQKCSSPVLKTRRASLGRNKELPATSQNFLGVKSVTPPNDSPEASHPFAFTPIIHCTSTSDSHFEFKAPITSQRTNPDPQSQIDGHLPLENRKNIARISTTSPVLRPWNLEESYPWDDETPALDVFTPFPKRGSSCSNPERVPRFKYRIQRASSSTGETGERIRRGRSSEDTSSSIFEPWTDRSIALPLRRKVHPDLLKHPGQTNSSHDIIQCRPLQTRFVESFQNPSRTSPIVTLVPPSPGHEVRSFFSDDSSQVQLKGSIRKRLSNFKTRQARSGSGGDHQGYDRGLLSSAFSISRASGRSSRQSRNAGDGASQRSRAGLLRWAMLHRIRSWFLRHEDRVREWRRKRQHKSSGPQGLEVQPYTEV